MFTVLNKGLSLNTKLVYAMPGKDTNTFKRNLCQKIKEMSARTQKAYKTNIQIQTLL